MHQNDGPSRSSNNTPSRHSIGDQGWTYTPTERHVFISEDGNTAWFDERLENDGFGECRGTGALVKEDGVWKVSQYNLTVPIPNELLRDVVAQIREQESDG